MIFAEIITIGDELLIGQVIDTNSAWMGQKLNEIGIKVKQITSVSDSKDHIVSALNEAALRADVILITGGLGPTKDDITKKTLADYFNSDMVLNEDSLRVIEEIFRTRGRQITEINRLQAMVPRKCKVLVNKNGTAPGMWFDENNKIYVSMPGVPGEMKGLMQDAVLPALEKKFHLPPVIHKTILTQGIGESFLSDKIESWELSLPSHIKLAYLPAGGTVRLRLSGSGKEAETLKQEIQTEIDRVLPLIDEYVFGYDLETLEELIGKRLIEKGKTLSTAESCTGGYIAQRIVSVPGASAYFMGSVVPYSNELKEKVLGVDSAVINSFGAVSEQTVRIMAENARKLMRTDFAIATSGIAGPTGGTEEKPVGTVWMAIAGPEETFVQKLQLGTNRLRIIHETSNFALNGLRKLLAKS
ncbi:MAG: competence/damage-inducible protein A [Bacteroidia bacterium]